MEDESKQSTPAEEKRKSLEFIENNSTKSDFIKWFNTQHDATFSEKDDWEDIKASILQNDDIKADDLQVYGASLTAERDTETLLENAKEETEKAEEAASKLFYLTKFKKFAIAIGGAVLLEGILLGGVAVAGLFDTISLSSFATAESIVAFALIFIGLTNIIAGLLLITR